MRTLKMNKFVSSRVEKYEKLGLAERHTNNSSLVLKLVALEIMGEFLTGEIIIGEKSFSVWVYVY